MNRIALVCILVISAYAEDTKLPSNFKKCNRNHNDFNNCLSSAVKDAVEQLTQPNEELGIPSLEPLNVPGMSVGDDVFTQLIDDAKIYGLTKPESLKFEIDLDKNTAKLEVDIPEVKVTGRFEVGGKLANKPVRGKALASVIVGKLHGCETFTLKETTSNGKKHLQIDNSKLTVSMGSVRVTLEKALNVNQATAEELVKHINDNWEDAYRHTKSGYEDLFGALIYAIFDNVLDRVPLDELFEQ